MRLRIEVIKMAVKTNLNWWNISDLSGNFSNYLRGFSRKECTRCPYVTEMVKKKVKGGKRLKKHGKYPCVEWTKIRHVQTSCEWHLCMLESDHVDLLLCLKCYNKCDIFVACRPEKCHDKCVNARSGSWNRKPFRSIIFLIVSYFIQTTVVDGNSIALHFPH